MRPVLKFKSSSSESSNLTTDPWRRSRSRRRAARAAGPLPEPQPFRSGARPRGRLSARGCAFHDASAGAPCWTADKWSRPDGARRWSLVASRASAWVSSGACSRGCCRRCSGRCCRRRVGAARAGVHGRAVVAGQPRQRAQQPQRSWSGARAWHLRRLASSLVAAGRRARAAAPLLALPSGRGRGTSSLLTGPEHCGCFPSRGGIVDTPPGALDNASRAAAHYSRRAERPAPGSLDTPPRRRRDTRTMGHPDDGLFVRTDLLPAGASHNEDRTTKTHAAGYVPPRHATPGGQKIMHTNIKSL